jgi:hypothetical protein
VFTNCYRLFNTDKKKLNTQAELEERGNKIRVDFTVKKNTLHTLLLNRFNMISVEINSLTPLFRSVRTRTGSRFVVSPSAFIAFIAVIW